MNRISTGSQVGGALLNLMQAQSRQMAAQAQVSSQTKATDLKGYGREAETLTALRSVRQRAEAYVSAAEMAGMRLATQNIALEQASDSAVSARQSVAEAIANGRAEGLMEALQLQYSSAVSALNTQHQGRYVFSGTAVNDRPVTASTLADLAAAPATADVFANDQRRAAVKIDESTTLQTGYLADEIGTGLFEVFRRIKQFADGPGGPLQGQLTQAQTAYLESELSAFDAAHNTLTEFTARNGGLQAQAEAALNSQQAHADHLEGLTGERTGVNLAEAITRLEQARTAVDASAQVLATLRSTSLLELLR